MNYCEAASDRFQRISDPWDNNRTCYKSIINAFDRNDLVRILEDKDFLFIKDSVVFFK